MDVGVDTVFRDTLSAHIRNNHMLPFDTFSLALLQHLLHGGAESPSASHAVSNLWAVLSHKCERNVLHLAEV